MSKLNLRIRGMLQYSKAQINAVEALIDDTRVLKYDMKTGETEMDCDSDFAKDICAVKDKLEDCIKDLDSILKKYE